jgi:hypothetical protein
VACGPDDWEDIGGGDAQKFQRLCKESPAFAADVAAVGLRIRRTYWDPINRHDVELWPECDDMLREVESYVNARMDAPTLAALLNL